jgi:hypothetical protein
MERNENYHLKATELLKYGGVNLWRRIYNLITIIWKNEEMSADWQMASVYPITI